MTSTETDKLSIFCIITVWMAVSLLSACGKSGVSQKEYTACVYKGRGYYKEIGSYPRLSTGAFAEGHIKFQCKRNPKYFNF